MGHYETCRRGIGRPVQIRMSNGAVHRGVIDRVSPGRVFLRPLGGRNYDGYGYGWGWGGFGTGLAIGAIAAIAFLPFFW